MLLIRSILFAILIPGTVTVTVPCILIVRNPTSIPVWGWIGLVPILFGAVVVIRCIRDFFITGRGTLAPVEPPAQLVINGLYRYVRNPMYVGVVTMVLGEAWLFASWPLLIHAAATFTVVHLFVLLHEEPTLRRRFGESYEYYLRTVPRWWPRKPRV